LADLGDKIDAGDKSEIEGKISAAKQALEGTDVEMIKAATEDLQKKFYDVSAKIYQQANPQGDPNMGANPGDGAQGGTYDGDYTVVDDEPKN